MAAFKANNILLPILCGGLTALSYAGAPMFPLVFFSLVPMYFFVKAGPLRTIFTYAFSLYFFGSLWLFSAYDFLPINKILSLFLIFILIIFIAFSQAFLLSFPFIFSKQIVKHNVSDAFTFATLYSLGELFQEIAPIAQFPWARLCNIASPFTVFIQSASLLGGIFVSFIIVAINFLIAENISFLIRKKISVKALIFLSLLFFGNILFGIIRLENKTEYEKKSALLIQANFEGNQKRSTTAREMLDEYERLIGENAAEVIILSETALPIDIEQNKTIKERLKWLAKSSDSVIITGVLHRENGKIYNSVRAVNEDGSLSLPYHKQILVPFGESYGILSPVAQMFPALSMYGGFSPGNSSEPIYTQAGNFGGIICYESSFPHIARNEVKSGAEVLCILSNDSWFGKTSALYQHHSHAIMRAVENKRYVLRSSSTAITSVISPYGEIKATAPKYREAVLGADYSLIRERTLYSILGDVFSLFGIALFLQSGMLFILSPRDSRTPPYQQH